MPEIKETKEVVYKASGLHCASCKAMIESKVSDLEGVEEASVDRAKSILKIKLRSDKVVTVNDLNNLFKDLGYSFSKNIDLKENKGREIALLVLLFLVIILAFFFSSKISLPSIDTNTSLLVVGGFGLMAGFSTCATLVGGLVLSVSKRWGGIDKNNTSSTPNILFNLGRIAGFGIFGGVLGFLGGSFASLIDFTPYISLLVSIFILISALQIAGFSLPSFNFGFAKSMMQRDKLKINRYEPLALGALSFFIPCGFTATAQAAALGSASFLNGFLIMIAFALGTALPLFMIGIFGQRIVNSKVSRITSFVVAVLLVIFAVWNGVNQINLIKARASSISEEESTPQKNEVEVIKMEVTRTGFNPSSFNVSAGSKVRWEITNISGTGCTNAIIAPSLFKGSVDLPLGKTTVKTFSASKTGKHTFSCWMGMVNGTINIK